ncbi:MAG TPA: tail fiber protein [Candidatus Angelobacter sp.]|nr:tail fiber protein [Candidatus Angelobacter sp.]
MSNPFVAEIRIFAGTFAPKGWALCDGQLLPISQNTALFSLLGTTYGGNGTSNFALPNLQGNAPMQAGQGPGLSLRDLGETGGEQTVTLLQTEMPAHSHSVQGSSTVANQLTPVNNAWASGQKGFGTFYAASGANNVQMNPFGTSIAGGNLPHNNMPPFLGLLFIIALQGVFPARS